MGGLDTAQKGDTKVKKIYPGCTGVGMALASAGPDPGRVTYSACAYTGGLSVILHFLVVFLKNLMVIRRPVLLQTSIMVEGDFPAF